jgi:hypothetical protein
MPEARFARSDSRRYNCSVAQEVTMTFRWLLAGVAASLLAASAPAQSAAMTAFDECGVLTPGSGCILVDTGSGRYIVTDAGRFAFGDEVRVVGTLDPACTSICPEADGCIRGAELYDPDFYPCGQAIPSFPADLVSGICTSASAGILLATFAGLFVTRPRHTRR